MRKDRLPLSTVSLAKRSCLLLLVGSAMSIPALAVISSEVTFGFSKYDGSLANGDPYNATIEADGTTDQMTFSDWRIDEFDDPDFGVNMNNGGPDSVFADPAGDNFQFVSFTTEVFCGTSWSFDVVGYKDGSPVAGATQSYNLGGVGGPATRSVGFASVDEVRFENYSTDDGNQCVVIDDIVVDQEAAGNTAPSFSNLDATVLFDEATGAPVVVDADATISDTEHDGINDYAGSTLTVEREGGANADDDFGFDTGAGTFTVSGGDLLSGGNVFASFTDNSGTLTISFTSIETLATSALVDDVLQGITYANTGSPTVVEYGLTLNFDDGGLQTSGSLPVEFDPELAAVTANTTYDLTELGPELSSQDPVDARIITESSFELLFHGFQFGDAAESGSVNSNELQLNQVTSDEGTTGVRFEADEPFLLESIDIDNFSNSAQDVVVHAYLNGSLVDSRSFSYGALSGYATRQFASANAAFANVDEIRVTTSDNDFVAFDNIVVDQGNNPPTLDLDTGTGGSGADAAFRENDHQGIAAADGVPVAGPVSASDSDGTIESVSLTFDNPQGDAGEGLAIDTGPLSADLGFSTSANLITITRNTATNAELVEAIEAVRYQNNSDTPDTTARSVTVEVTDDQGSTASATSTVTVEAGNDAPSITAPGGTLQPDEDVAFDLSGANEIQIVDVDAGGATIEVSLSANNGTLTLGSTTGLAFDSGSNGAGALTVSGTVSDLNNALATLDYQGNSDYFGADTINATVNDRGHTGTDPGNTGDGSSETDTASVSLDVQPVADAPTITAIADQSTNEDTTLSGIAFTVDDAETAAGSLTVSFSADTPALIAGHTFGGSGANRTLEIVPAPDQNGSTLITVEVDDGGLTATEDFLLTINAVNDLPTVSPAIGTLDATVTEDGAVPSASITVDDVESGGGGVTVTASSDNQTLAPDANLSVTDNGGGDRTLDVTLAPDENGTANITVTLDDGTGTVDDSFQLTVNPENDAPAVSLDQNSDTIAENNGGNVAVAQITINDDNEAGSTNNLSLTGPDAGDFAINGSDLEFTGSADFEVKNTYDVVVEVDDPGVGAVPDDTASFTLDISDVDETPTFSATGPFAVSESDGNGTAVGDVDAVDGDGGAADANLTYAITGGNTGGAFAIDAATGAITVADATAVDFDTSPAFNLDIEADDGANAPITTVAVNVSNAAPSTPVDGDGTNGGTVAENAANGTAVGITADSSDPGGGNVSYALTDDAGGRFQINAGTGVVTVADASLLDFESATSHSISVRASDDDGADSATASFTIAVTDVNSPPVFTANGPFAVSESAANGSAIGDVDANDGDAGPADAGVSYAITAGNGGGVFSIDNSGAIAVANTSLIDFESSASFTLTVEADDGGQTTPGTVTVNVSDEPPAVPVDADGAANTVAEDAANGDPVGVTAEADDPGGGTVTYAMTDDAGGRFQINAGTGVVTVADGSLLNFNSAASHTVEIEARDADGSASAAGSFTINLSNVNEAPDITNTPAGTVAEDSAYSFTPSVSDPDGGDTHTFTITGKPGWADFDTATGTLSGTPVNEDVRDYHGITITVTDSGGLQDSITFDLSVTQVNDPPVLPTRLDAFAAAGDTPQRLWPAVLFDDPDSPDLDGGRLRIVQTGGGAAGSFGVDGETVAAGGDATLTGGETVSTDGAGIASVDGSEDGQEGRPLRLDFNGSATPARVQSLLRHIRYTPGGEIGTREFELTLGDGDKASKKSFTINVEEFSNDDSVLQDETIVPGRSVSGARLIGDIRNEGVVSDVTLAEGATLTGGRACGMIDNGGLIRDTRLCAGAVIEGGAIGGVIEGEESNNPPMINSRIRAGTMLRNVVIGPDAEVSPDIVPGEGVRFASGTNIPPGLDLGGLFNGVTWNEEDRVTGLNLDRTIIDGQGSVMEELRSLPTFRQPGTGITQDPQDGEMRAVIGDSEARLFPVRVTPADGPVGATVTGDGDVVTVTDGGQRVVSHPLIQDVPALRSELSKQGLSASFDERAVLTVEPSDTADGNLRYRARGGLFSRPAPGGTAPGLTVYTRKQPPANVAGASLVFENESGEMRQQELVPAPADWFTLKESLEALSGAGNAAINERGVISLTIGGTEIRAMADLAVTSGGTEEGGGVTFNPVGDLNGDGTLDYTLVYPDGSLQDLYILPR